MASSHSAVTSHPRAYLVVIWAIPLLIGLFMAGVVAAALSSGNRQLLKDGLDWGYDVVIYGIAAIVFGRGARAEAVAALIVGAIIAFAGLHTLYDLSDKIADPRPIDPLVLEFSAASAIVIAVLIVAAIFPFRGSNNPLIEASWIASRNDLVSTTVYALAGLGARLLPFRAPEYALDIFAACVSFQAAYAIAREAWRNAPARES